MIIGTKTDLLHALQLIGADTPKAAAIVQRVEWVVPDSIWIVRELHDGPFERHVEDRARKTGTVPKLVFASPAVNNKTNNYLEVLRFRRDQLRTAFGLDDGDSNPQLNIVLEKMAGDTIAPIPRRPQPKHLPPAKKPPTMFKKVASLWSAVTGPRLEQRKRDRRLSMCTKYGGYSWAETAGVVDSVTAVPAEGGVVTQLTIGGRTQNLASDERPAVNVGDRVVVGQLVATGDAVKPCPYLLEKPSTEATRSANLYCNACGCGVRKKAELHSKLFFGKLVCPRTPPLFVEEAPDA